MEYFIALKKSKFICLSESHLGALPHFDGALCNNSQQQFPAISYFLSQRAPP